ncbi:hypothetical protein [Streptomyces sp. WAC01280]|uniref:hypothetical protein n=1 Tax=Streptomyces sp. WAC01280 TaxID=2487424 RepID=UPI000F7742C1|nr:hypothetical protein [Streptomyces sp. WAC01280]RSS59859.1 hypothetical protein EF909_08345 [Streptomyces sp. WAC01280]
MNARGELLAGLSELMANPFIPELHKDSCDDASCVRCEGENDLDDTHPAPCWFPFEERCTCNEWPGGAR